MAKELLNFEMTDDSGFLGLVDPSAYTSFVTEELAFDIFSRHAIEQMRKHHMLFWGTGMENFWRVQIATTPTKVKGFREKTGVIQSSAGQLCLTNYENLSMAFMYEDQRMPQPGDEVFAVPKGIYAARIVQMADPDDDHATVHKLSDFLIELLPVSETSPAWSKIPWCEAYT